MNNSYFLIALLLLLALILTFMFPPEVAASNLPDDESNYIMGGEGNYDSQDFIRIQILEARSKFRSSYLLGVDRDNYDERWLWSISAYAKWSKDKVSRSQSFLGASQWSYSQSIMHTSSLRQSPVRQPRSLIYWNAERQHPRYDSEGQDANRIRTSWNHTDRKDSQKHEIQIRKRGDIGEGISQRIWRDSMGDFSNPSRGNLGACPIEQFNPECDDGNLFSGYWWRGEGFVPGLITMQTHFVPSPPHIKGQAVYYAAGVMESTAAYMGYDLNRFLDGVAMMSPADIGQIVWLRRTGGEWEGPFLVVDTAELDDHFAISIFRDEVVEVGFKTAERWGIIEEWKTSVEVIKSRYRPIEDLGTPVDYSEWFLETVRFYPSGRTGLPSRLIFRQPAEWYIEGEWRSFLAWKENKMYTEPWIRDLIYRKD